MSRVYFKYVSLLYNILRCITIGLPTSSSLLPLFSHEKMKNVWCIIWLGWLRKVSVPSALTRMSSSATSTIIATWGNTTWGSELDRMKANYKDFTMLLTGKVGTGFGWDQSTNTVTNSE